MRGLSLHSRPIRDFDFRLEWAIPNSILAYRASIVGSLRKYYCPRRISFYRKPSLALRIGILEFPGATNLG